MAGNRDDFTDKTKELLAKRAGCRCSNPYCRALTYGSATQPDAVVNIGEAAHICAAAPGGPRYDPQMTHEERRHIGNGIWLCRSCAKLIDSDTQRYSVALLHEWKARAERETQLELERSRNKTRKTEIPFQERIRELTGAISSCDSYEAVMECLFRLQDEMDILVGRMEELRDKVELAKKNADRQWERIYETQFRNTLSLFEQLSNESRDMHLQARQLKKHMVSLGQDAPGRAVEVFFEIDVSGSMAGHRIGLSDKRFIAARAEELLKRLHDGWRRAAELETELDKLFAARHQYELMELELLEALSV